MLHQLLNITRPLFVIDAETTGVDYKTDRIIELGFQQWTAEGMVKEWRWYVNPEMPIPAASTAIHGITDAVVTGCKICGYSQIQHPSLFGRASKCEEFRPWPTFAHLAPNLAKGLVGCDFAGKNVRFDLRILTADFQRAGVEWVYNEARIVDIDRLEALAIPRDLSTLYERYTGRPLEGAHGALSDVRASAELIVIQLERHSILPRDLDTLHRAQWRGWIDGEGKFKFVDGVPCLTMWGKYAGKPMAEVPVDYWDYILRAKGDKAYSRETKMYAAAAKLKQFPTEDEIMNGTIKKLLTDKQCGFITSDSGADFFFHKSALKNADYHTLREGQQVTFEDGEGPKGPRAEDIFVESA